jgi:hypothetical protein
MYHRGNGINEGLVVFSRGLKRVAVYDSGKRTATKVDNEGEAFIG